MLLGGKRRFYRMGKWLCECAEVAVRNVDLTKDPHIAVVVVSLEQWECPRRGKGGRGARKVYRYGNVLRFPLVTSTTKVSEHSLGRFLLGGHFPKID